MHSQATGQWAESEAERILLGSYPPQTQVWYRNWRSGARWELDRILLEPDVVRGGYTAVFVEVRYRARAAVGVFSAADSLRWTKRRQLKGAIRVFLAQQHKGLGREPDLRGIRVDFWFGSSGHWDVLRGLDLG